MNLLSFWGKSQPLDLDRGPQWQPLPHLCLDVAAVGEATLNRHSGLRQSLPSLLDPIGEETIPIVCFLLCLQDIGKFAKKVQSKVPERYPCCFGKAPARVGTIFDHGNGGAAAVCSRPR